MKVLFVASEAFPFIKTGGLGDVIYALPKALRQIGIDARVILPKYGDIPEAFKEKMTNVSVYNVPVGWRNQYCGLEELNDEGVPFYFIDNEYYFKRQGIYGFYDDAERFAFFNRAILESMRHMDFKPDIIHCHDWHTGMVSVLLDAHYKNDTEYQKIKSVFTIHNLQYQGVFPKEMLGELFSLSDQYFREDALEFYGEVNFMKGGLVFSDTITTVSRTYAHEIQTPFFGERLDDLMRKKSQKLHGIVNGIDYSIFNPSTDKQLYVNYEVETADKKVENKVKLQAQLGLPVNKDIPMIAMVSRLTKQKGIDIIQPILDNILALGVQMVILGTGDVQYESLFREYAVRYPEQVAAHILFDDGLSRKIYAASDLFLMPSLFEPCGIGQLIALRYGSIPIVRETGGLNDTISAFNDLTEEGNGFSFTHYNSHDLLYTVNRGILIYKNDKNRWFNLVKKAMGEDFSWKQSATIYKELYQSLV